MRSLARDVIETLGSLITRPPLAVELATPLAEVSRLLLQYRVPAIAVVEHDHLKGLVTRSDVLRAHDDHHTTAGDAMTGYVLALPARSSVERAAALMAYEGVGQVCVTNDAGELLGMVSALDVTRHYAIASGLLAE